MLSGILNIDKPSGQTSHDVVERVRALTGIRRVGHTGTLDPLATGVLVVCVGRLATRVAEYLMDEPKTYRTDARLGAATDTMTMSGRKTLTGLRCTQEAARQAYEMAGMGPQDIDVAEVHDCFTIAEMTAYEDLGFARAGEGPRLIEEKQTYADGKIPVNVDGGLLSKGHPIGATGGSQVRTIVRQLRGEATEAQVKDAEIGLVHNIGGVGQYGNVTILRR